MKAKRRTKCLILKAKYQPQLAPFPIGRDKTHPYFQTTLRTIMQTDMGQMRPADFANDGQPQP